LKTGIDDSQTLTQTGQTHPRDSRMAGLSCPIRVAHLVPTCEGAVWASEMMAGLAPRGYELLAVIESDRGGLARRLRATGIRFHVVPLKGVRLAHSLPRLVRLLRRERVDILHTHLFRGQIFGRIAARLARVPLCVTMVAGPWQLEVPILARLDLATNWMDDATISSSRYTLDLYKSRGASEERQRLIYYGPRAEIFDPRRADGVRLRRELGIPAASPVVGLAAYFYPPKRWRFLMPAAVRGRGIKGHEDAIHAAALVRAQKPDVRFVFVGGPWNGRHGERYLHSLKRLVRKLGLAETVLFAGFRPDIADVLASFDVALQCSLSENLGGTIEALLMERPTVATRVGGMTDSVIDGRTGLLVPPRNPQALADAILQLLNNPEQAKELGRNGREWMQSRFTLTQTVDDVDQLYRQLARSKGLSADFSPVEKGAETSGPPSRDTAPTGAIDANRPSGELGPLQRRWTAILPTLTGTEPRIKG
jgi:glycosyltransferase involved in cell wall biosynthesis